VDSLLRPYRVILADPPWDYRNWTDSAHGAADSAMETMATADIANIPVGRWANDGGCLLAMWATWPKLEDAFSLIRAWGFEFVTGWPWVKTLPARGEIRRGIGFWSQSCSEPMLLARRGKTPRPDAGEPLIGLLHGADERVFYAPRGIHSEKPLEVHAWLETLPGPRLELFARRERPGWTCYGLDIGWRLGPDGATPVALPPAGALFHNGGIQ